MTNAEAIEILRQKYRTVSQCLTADDCRSNNEAVRLAISALERDRWISVVDRLPEERGSYLVAVHQDDSEYAEGYSLVLNAWYNPQTYPFTTVGWTLLNEWYDLTPRLREEITHWMPLPEPPEENKL